jgi:hypothetical protein
MMILTMSNGIASRMATNFNVCREEWADYRVQIAVVMGRVRRTDGLVRKLHHLSGLGPDIHRLMPRTLWYSGWLLGAVLAIAFGWVFFI